MRSSCKIGVVALAVWLAVASTAWADAPSLTLTPVVLVHDGVSGQWFSDDQAAFILYQLQTTLPELQALVKEQDALAATYKLQVAALTELAATEHSTAQREKDMSAYWQQELRAEQSRNAPSLFKEPAFWIAVGLIAGIGASIGIAHGLR